MLDLQSNQEEVYASHNDILQVVLRFRVLELNMQTILNSHIHLDRAVHLRRNSIRVDPDILLPNHIRHSSRHCDSNEIS